jgi:hypothetical protein
MYPYSQVSDQSIPRPCSPLTVQVVTEGWVEAQILGEAVVVPPVAAASVGTHPGPVFQPRPVAVVVESATSSRSNGGVLKGSVNGVSRSVDVYFGRYNG